MYMHLAAFKHEAHEMDSLIGSIEALFLADMLLSFITDFEDPLRPMDKSVRDHQRIAQRYFGSNFKVDAVSLMPFWFLNMEKNR